MEQGLKYGKDTVALKLRDENYLGTICGNNDEAGLINPEIHIKKAIAEPVGTKPLGELIREKRPTEVAIVVNDVTRPTPYKLMLPPLLQEIHRAGVTAEQVVFVIATGIHRGNTEQENRNVFGDELVDGYEFINHDCQGEVVSLGKLADGNEFKVNKRVAEADFVITTGLITLHYFAGFSGGRKSILPGVVSKDLITLNHARMTEPGAETGSVANNPVHHIMMEAARKVGVDFILNVVTDSQKEITGVFAGDLEQAWLKGVKACAGRNMVTIPFSADVIVASAGGYPKDVNMYQAQKAIDHAAQAVKKGGTIILVAQCPEGYGEDIFEAWMREANELDDIFLRFKKGFVLGGHKAYAIATVLKDIEVVLVSELDKDEVEGFFCTWQPDLPAALEYVSIKHGKNFKAWIMPEAGAVLPAVGGRHDENCTNCP